MRLALIAALALTACSDDGTAPEFPRGSWRNGAWTCNSGCGGGPSVTSATWVEISGTDVRWFNAEGGLIETDAGAEDGLCVHVTGATTADLCIDACDGVACLRAEGVAFGGSSWTFEAKR